MAIEALQTKVSKKAINLTDGAPLDTQEIKMAKKKLEDLYKTKGYPKTQIEIIEGNEKGDSNVVFVIHEDEHQKIWKVNFEGQQHCFRCSTEDPN